jgi:hypothetical protein
MKPLFLSIVVPSFAMLTIKKLIALKTLQVNSNNTSFNNIATPQLKESFQCFLGVGLNLSIVNKTSSLPNPMLPNL